ncbi:hypothetical protein [Streptomyces sp. NPDC059802]|uniref:hypothetical protein n=1 Tax=Streptomyces sp. NPDC059802 TaxID=3346952 RepID=UPI00365734A8
MWESGRRRTVKRTRAGLCRLYRERPEVLTAHQGGVATGVLETSGTAVVVRMPSRWRDLVEVMVHVAAGGARAVGRRGASRAGRPGSSVRFPESRGITRAQG